MNDFKYLKSVSDKEFLDITSHLIVSYAKEKGMINLLISGAQEELKPIFQESLKNIRDNDLDNLLKNQ